jgi:hypothetical protein
MVNIPPIKSLNHDAATSLGGIDAVINATLKQTANVFFTLVIKGSRFAFISSVAFCLSV